LVVVAFLGGVLLVALGSLAAAQTYATGMSLDPQSAAPGAQVVVRASGLRPNLAVRLLFDSVEVATTDVDANGVAQHEVVIPATASQGEHTVTIAKDAGTPSTSPSTTSVLLEKTITVATGGDAFHHDDGPPVNTLTIAGFVIVATAIPFLLLRPRRVSSR
jgi:hypothetical protein